MGLSFIALIIIFIGVFVGVQARKKEFYEEKIKQKGFKNLEID